MYCSLADINNDINNETELIELTNANSIGSGATVKTSIITEKIAQMTDKINSYLLDIYPLPIDNTTDLSVLKGICVSLVVCELYQTKYQMEPPEGLTIRRKNAISDLEKIQKRVMRLHTTSTSTTGSSEYRVSSRTKIFTDEMLYDAL